MVDDLQNNLEAESKRCEQFASQVKGLEEENRQLLESNKNKLADYKDAVKTCFYMFWKHNRNANFSYLPTTTFFEEEDECLQRLAEEEVDALEDVPPRDPQE